VYPATGSHDVALGGGMFAAAPGVYALKQSYPSLKQGDREPIGWKLQIARDSDGFVPYNVYAVCLGRAAQPGTPGGAGASSVPEGECGNGIREGAEECDGADSQPIQCGVAPGTVGPGELVCNSSCRYSAEQCSNACNSDADCAGNQCVANATCSDRHVCEGGTPVNADDGNACTVDICNPATGAISHDEPIVCDDGDPNTVDSCDPLGGCQARYACNEGVDCQDDDGDGIPASLDCNDNDASINPYMGEMCGDNVDSNCNGQIDDGCNLDNDGDGYTIPSDCNDADAAVYPDAPEICWDGKDNNCDAQLDEGCGSGVCGNGVVEASESCDDGNAANGDGCGADCHGEVGYQCTGASPSVCTYVATCGDGVIDAGEACDDGNGAAGDGCSNVCQVESGFECSGVPTACFATAACGNGIMEQGEQCDDGNTVNGDGCANSCLVESGFECSGLPSICLPSGNSCDTALDCPGAPTSSCMQGDCVGNQCGLTPLPSGTVCGSGPGGVQQLCDGTGQCR
jgi:cysteine-rich repeat protein